MMTQNTKHHRLSLALGLVLSVSCGNPKDDKATQTQQPSSLVEIQFNHTPYWGSHWSLRADEFREAEADSSETTVRIFTDMSYSGVEAANLKYLAYALQWPQDAIIDGLIETEDWDGSSTYKRCVVEVELIAAPERICSPKHCEWSLPLAQVARDGCWVHDDNDDEFPFDEVKVSDFSLFIELDYELDLTNIEYFRYWYG